MTMPLHRAIARPALMFGLLLAWGVLPGARANDPNPAKAEADLKAVRAQMEKVRAEMERDAGRRDKLARELEESEKTVGTARGELDKLRRERAQHTARRAELAAERRVEAGPRARPGALAGQIRAASMIGPQEPIKLLLNQRDPAQAGRVLTYYRYFGRARADQIAAINAHVGELATLDAALAAEEERLAALEDQQRGELSQLQCARERRGRALVSLETESKNRAKELERLKDQQGGLEKLVRELRRALERIDKFPTDSKDAFAKLRGKLAWPVSGRLVASYGQTRAGGMKWDGLLLAGSQGSPGARGVSRARGVRGLAVGPGTADHHRPRRRLLEPVRPQRPALQGSRRAGHGRGHHRDDGGFGRPAAPRAVFRDPQGGRPVDPRPWFGSPRRPRRRTAR